MEFKNRARVIRKSALTTTTTTTEANWERDKEKSTPHEITIQPKQFIYF